MTARQTFILSAETLEINDMQRLALCHAFFMATEHCEPIYVYADEKIRQYVRVRESESAGMTYAPMCIVAPTGDILIPAAESE